MRAAVFVLVLSAAALAGYLRDLAWPGVHEGGRLEIVQGEDMGRTSRLFGRTLREAGEVTRVHVGGGAVVMMDGLLHL